MITFRYHIVTLVSVFLALAVGVALGGGPLKGGVDNSLVKEVASRKEAQAKLHAELRDFKSRAMFSDRVLKDTSQAILENRLKGARIALVSLPGASGQSTSRVTDSIQNAGGILVGRYRLGEKLVRPDAKGLVDQLTVQLANGMTDLPAIPNATSYERAGILLQRAISAPQRKGAPLDPEATQILSGVTTAELFTSQGDPLRRAGAVVVLTGAQTDPDMMEATDQVLRGMAADGRAVVVVGPREAADPDGLLRFVRDDIASSSVLSTVDTVDSSVGGIVTTLAVAHGLRVGPGHYGSHGASNGALPVTHRR